jgi:hypothetical protein
MKKSLLYIFTVTLCFFLISWGYDGHHAIAKIAENHLSPNAASAVKNILGHESMADVSSYADEMRSEPAFKATGVFHYIDIPVGYNFEQFSSTVKAGANANIYGALISAIRDLKNPSKGRTQKSLALKFLIHLAGDSHQPMHVGRAEDRGGNNINVVFLGQSNNLHGLWDDGLLEHERLNYKEIAAKYDDATPEQIKKWQSDDIMVWLWESYQISTILYQEAADDPKFDEKYYQNHIPIVKNRIEKAGIRLAGVLNSIYK